MTIYFYAYDGDPRTVGKSFDPDTLLTVSSADVYGASSLLAPTLIMAYSADLSSKNYMVISDWGRTYRITGMTLDSGGRLIVSGAVDVLTTYADAIRACRAQAVRSASAGYTMVPDSAYPLDAVREYVTSTQLSASDLDPPGVLPPNPRRFVLTLK